MSNFLYFLPNTRQSEVNSESLEACGMAYAFDGERPYCREVLGRGPGGTAGVIVAPNDAGLGYYEDKQTWLPHSEGKAWVGCYSDQLPTADDLKRKRLLDGHVIGLRDGHEWQIPLVRMWQVEDNERAGFIPSLPCVMGPDAEALARGELVLSWGSTEAKYRHLEGLAAEWADYQTLDVEAKGNHPFSMLDDRTRLAVTILSVNYRVSLAEVMLLNLFESRGDLATVVLDVAVFDWPNLEPWLQKKRDTAGGGLSSLAGQEVSPSQDTGQLSPTS